MTITERQDRIAKLTAELKRERKALKLQQKLRDLESGAVAAPIPARSGTNPS